MGGKRSQRALLTPGSGPLSRVPPSAAFLGVIVLFGVGVLVRGALGAALLGALALGVAALLAASWRALNPGERAMRLVVLLALVMVAVSVLGG